MKDSVKSWPTDYPDQIDGMDCLFLTDMLPLRTCVIELTGKGGLITTLFVC
jgi:hypothetical protein